MPFAYLVLDISGKGQSISRRFWGGRALNLWKGREITGKFFGTRGFPRMPKFVPDKSNVLCGDHGSNPGLDISFRGDDLVILTALRRRTRSVATDTSGYVLYLDGRSPVEGSARRYKSERAPLQALSRESPAFPRQSPTPAPPQCPSPGAQPPSAPPASSCTPSARGCARCARGVKGAPRGREAERSSDGTVDGDDGKYGGGEEGGFDARKGGGGGGGGEDARAIRGSAEGLEPEARSSWAKREGVRSCRRTSAARRRGRAWGAPGACIARGGRRARRGIWPWA
ncbi:hypothetical protein C8F04DRAFT_1294035 [Mycena alexandri]|uniref:Uncharacterized protein n=1 Tax=Mycena alexandri TaxID=1745969 RepID=A0AAD6SGK4_9AGAR|nr:hypothetical protein C8F04DRAFT_1294035 [Mycena alexandri]